MVPVLGQKVQDQFDRWEYHDREFRQYCIDKLNIQEQKQELIYGTSIKVLVSFQMFGSIQNKKKNNNML